MCALICAPVSINWTCPKGSTSFLKPYNINFAKFGSHQSLGSQHSTALASPVANCLSQHGRRKMFDAMAYVGSVQDSLCIGTLLNQGQKSVRDCSQLLMQWPNYFLRVISSLTHYSGIVSDIPSGSISWNILDMYSDILQYLTFFSCMHSAILSGILSDIFFDVLSAMYSDILVAFCLASTVAFCLAFYLACVWFQLRSTASGAGDMVFGSWHEGAGRQDEERKKRTGTFF